MGPRPDPQLEQRRLDRRCRSASATRSRALVGAGAGEVIVADSTSVNLFKVLSAPRSTLAGADAPARRDHRLRAQQLPDRPLHRRSARARARLRAAAGRRATIWRAALGDDIAVLMLTHVNYRTGRMHDMAAIDARRARAGALVVWDLAHSAGAVPVELHGDGRRRAADFAVGCGYKYLNGGPGAPAFVWAHPRHTAPHGRRAAGASRCPAGWATRRRSSSRRLPARARHRALRLRHAAGAVAGGARMRRRHAARPPRPSAAWPRCARSRSR